MKVYMMVFFVMLRKLFFQFEENENRKFFKVFQLSNDKERYYFFYNELYVI